MNNKELELFIQTNFDLKGLDGQLDTESEYLKFIHVELSKRIVFLIRTNLDRLLQILYRIDVPQAQTDQAFALGEVNQIANELAKLIITRQLQKIDYAKKFYGK